MQLILPVSAQGTGCLITQVREANRHSYGRDRGDVTMEENSGDAFQAPPAFLCDASWERQYKIRGQR